MDETNGNVIAFRTSATRARGYAAKTDGTVWEWRTRANRYPETDRRAAWTTGVAVRCVHPVTKQDTVVLFGTVDARAVYVIDDGRTVDAMFVAGWNRADRAVFLNRYPVDTAGKRDGDDNRAYDTWELEPRMSYHVKITPARNEQ